MVQGYYSLEEAARILGMPAEELSHMAQRREVRAFADRGTWRFRTQDVEELARQRGRGSDPELQYGETTRPRPHDSPAPRKPAVDDPNAPIPLVDDSDQVEIGQEALSGSSAGRKKPGGKSSAKNLSPPPKPGSDSDVRLVAEGSELGFQIASDSDVKVVDDASPGSKSGSKSGSKKKTNVAAEAKGDSGALIIPVESDSDVKIVPERPEDSVVRLSEEGPRGGTDSDIRLELDPSPRSRSGLPPASDPGTEDSVLTEEIDLDAELRKAEEASRARQSRGKAPAPAPKPSPPESRSGRTPKPAPGHKLTDSSSDFDLTPMAPATAPRAEKPGKEEEVDLGDLSFGGARPGTDSGINLRDPADSGISLEKAAEKSDEVEFELSLEGEGTPQPKPAEAGEKEVDSDSEFQLTLDDSGGLAPLEDEKGPEASDKDIFETDFEVPALEDDSGSEAVALDESDTDLESSDFELAIGDEDMVADEESGSQVVALEDEEDEADEGAATVAKTRRQRAALAEDEEEAVEELDEEEERPRGRVAAAPATADWGWMPATFMSLSLIVMLLGGLMSFELLRGMWGYHQSQRVTGAVVDPLTRAFLPEGYLPPADK
jgi:hypothetical protein